jgi:2-methylcitrate dehydratase
LTIVEELADFVTRAKYEDLTERAREQLKVRILDALGCAVGALTAQPIRAVRALIDDFGGRPLVTLIGGGLSAPDRAAFYNATLIRYLDFNDAYLAPGETCHPSDNLGPVLAAAEYTRRSGRELLVSLAVAYQVQCRLSDVAPLRAKGFDHVTQGAYAVAAGVSRALGLDSNQTANAIAMSGTALNALRVTRTGALSHWKGFACANTAFAATHSAFLAMRGITGPREIFEGRKGFMDAIAGKFTIDWSREGLDGVMHTVVKKYNAEIHAQSALDGVLELRTRGGVSVEDITAVEVDIFEVAHNIIGGGEEGNKQAVQTKEDADHSLHYMLAAALIDGAVTPAQFEATRIMRADVQALLRKVVVRPAQEYSRRFPSEMPCRISIVLRDGRRLVIEKIDYEGFHTNPLGWDRAGEKFAALTEAHTDAHLRNQISEAVASLERREVSELTRALARVSG